ncbi:Uncharacterized protein SCF082_LOCUS11344 [Durusdinium trenchii]|uniref:Uncharacterized protein n=1 Tax=Durusdinium trenchii TaxID=1381693 RepID=A0ABP0JCD6_9DINO
MSKNCTPAASIRSTDAELTLKLKLAIRNWEYGQCILWAECSSASGDATTSDKCLSSVGPCQGSSQELFAKTDADVSSGTFTLFAEDLDGEHTVKAYYTTNLLKTTFYHATDTVANQFYGFQEDDDDNGQKIYIKQKGEFSLDFSRYGTTNSNQDDPDAAYQWTFDELPGLSELHLHCGDQQVLQDLQKIEENGEHVFKWKCATVAGLGSCWEEVSLEVPLSDVASLKFVLVDCGERNALRALEFEPNIATASLRLKGTCCSLAMLPVALNPTEEFSDFSENSGFSLQQAEGMYCPTGLDDSGRPSFKQTFSFKPDATATGTLLYNRAEGKWEVTESTNSWAVEADVVHPLDLGDTELVSSGSQESLHVMPMLDFNSIFTGKGVEALATPETSSAVTKWKTPPTLLTFAADDPDYVPECQDKFHPGDANFKRDEMNDNAEGLWSDDPQNPAENPCAYIYSTESYETGQSLQNVKLGAGMSWEPRDKVRSDPDYGNDGSSGTAGRGLTYRTVKECSDREISREYDLGDIQNFRDAVKKGDAAILTGLESVAETISNNTRKLFEFYLGQDQGGSDNPNLIVQGMTRSLDEMKQMVQSAQMHPLEATATTRTINTFLAHARSTGNSDLNASNLSSHLGHMSSRVQKLRALVSETTSRKLTSSQYTAVNVAEYVKSMTEVMRSKAHTLGVFHHRAVKSKEKHHWLHKHAAEKSAEDILAEAQEDSIMLSLSSIDKTWWQLRATFDLYFADTEDYLGAFKNALVALDGYTERCSMSFLDLKSAYATFARADAKVHQTLQGVLDTEILKRFARLDLATFNATAKLDGSPLKTLCARPDAKGSGQGGANVFGSCAEWGTQIHQRPNVSKDFQFAEVTAGRPRREG